MEFSVDSRKAAIAYLCKPEWKADSAVHRFLEWMLEFQIQKADFRLTHDRIYHEFLFKDTTADVSPEAVNDAVGPFLKRIREHIDRVYNRAEKWPGQSAEPPYVRIPTYLTGSPAGRITLWFEQDRKSHSNAGRIPKGRSRPEDNPAWLLWKALLHPVRGEKGALIYSNEQPELGEALQATLGGRYSGSCEPAASFLVGQCIAHQKVSFKTIRSSVIAQSMSEGEEQKLLSWRALIFLGSSFINTALAELLEEYPWRVRQHFHFKSHGEFTAIYKGSPERPEGRPWVSSSWTEYALVSYFKNKGQVLIGLAGNQTIGTWGAAKALCDPDCAARLMKELKLAENAMVPSFEIVMEISTKKGIPDDGFKIVDRYIHSE